MATAFGAELRRWRTARQLSQLELAVRSGTTQRHVSFLESGRSAPGRILVIRLAEALELALRDRNALLHCAGYRPAYPQSDIADPALAPVRVALAQILDGHMPYPAIVAGPRGHVLMANAAFTVLLDGADEALRIDPINVWRLALHPDGLARRIVNLAEWGRHVTDGLRTYQRRQPSPELGELIGELEGYLPPFAPPDAGYLGVAVPLRLQTPDGELNLITTLTSFATAVDVTLAELHLEAWLPADERTADLLHRRQRALQPGPSGAPFTASPC